MARNNRRNVLPNTYVPVLSKKALTTVLMRLPKRSLLELVQRWPQLANTQPNIDGAKPREIRRIGKEILETVRQWRASSAGVSKRTIVDTIVHEWWSGGLNLLQLSQIDCQLIVDRPNAYSWVYSTVRDFKGAEVAVSLDPAKFLDRLSMDLSTLYLSYIYICRHPQLPLVLIRIQVFDIQPMSTVKRSNRPHISSNRPFLAAIPMNSSHIIHSPGDDVVSSIVHQAIERSLPQSRGRPLTLEAATNQAPVRSLESMHILHGSSRFAKSMGAWAPYADNSVDISPLGDTINHALASENVRVPPVVSPLQELKTIANLRFKGTKDGKYKSEKLYDDDEGSKPKRWHGDHEDEAEENLTTSEFTSIAPIQHVSFLLKEPVEKLGDEAAIKITLAGSDVYAGLHELSVSTTDESEMVLDPRSIPNWLTGS